MADKVPPFRNVTKRPGPPKAAGARLQALFAPHVHSFDYFLDEGLSRCVAGLEAQELAHPAGGPRLRFWLESVKVSKPMRVEPGLLESKPLYPAECRERAVSYKGAMHGFFCYQVGDGEPERIERRLGLMPVMVRSKLCHLHGLSGRGLVAKHEEGGECGGFFVCNGNERAIRLLIAPRRNHMMAIVRPSFKNRGPDYTPNAVTIRCVRPDGTSQVTPSRPTDATLSRTPRRVLHTARAALATLPLPSYLPRSTLPSAWPLRPAAAECLATRTGRPPPPVLLADPPACAPVGWPRRRSPCTCSRRAAPTSA